MAIENNHNVAPVDETIAVKANDIDQVPHLLEEIAKQGKALTQDGAQNRRRLLETVRSLSYVLETPREAIIRYCWSQPTIFAAIELGINLGLFKVLSKDDKPKTAAELAEATGAEPVFLSRVLKHLGAMGAIYEIGPDTYKPSNFAKTLTIQKYADGFPCMTDCINAAVLAFPQWLKKNGYQAPSDGKNTALKLGFNTDLHFFEFLATNPVYPVRFMNHMSAYHQGRPSWMDPGFYPVQERLSAGLDTSAPLLVDVGGSTGHDLKEFHRKHPEAQGKLILQDLPEVIENAKLVDSDGIEAMAHDFFKEQPIKGARAYYMHSVLHDWPDNKCKEILTNLAQAMKPGYSKVLINENVIPDMDADWQTTSLDFIMMSVFASKERTERQWHALVESAGLKIVKIFTAEKGVESLIECELA
ncbi:O-methyltransferase, putative [Talaromyces stipitatus ATCC 10500]|uniref:O-methyltransferase, putative n=1 Tax=Talaromyces stipitatus (strain ATCC 10500 / CBS 375.48 / QM 6759 / NRRL 1006) TaxID=441959 RepID=B8M5A8_TALSN|nr:O-methyltransferase, putative [Talaromyces stipitatus ATCC 10500]EED19714.1 O-methyltransferase, putative [Talaromyces stipitatus ATCC 10500]